MKSKHFHNFGGLTAEYSDYKKSKIVILPVPFDRTSSWIRGSDRGPEAIISASAHMELYDTETGSEVYRKGIHTAGEIPAGSSRQMIGKVNRKVVKLLNDGKFVVVLGGEHTVSLGSITAHAGHFSNMCILHLDAHTDMRDSYEGNRYSHACVMARAKEITENIISVGIRSMASCELENIRRENIFYADEIRRSRDWIERVVERLSGNVYITVDVDVFDPSIMPSTGTPEPGGLTWYETIDLLRHVSGERNIVGFDVVELCPSKGAPAPDFMAARLIYKLLGFKFPIAGDSHG